MRLIDADTLKAEFTGNFHETWHYTGVRATIDNAPTIDAVPVVRCKDCIYAAEDPIIEGAYSCWVIQNGFCVTGDYFCRYGKPRDTACDS